MGDESRYRYRRDDAATGSGPGSRPAQAASGDRASGRDPLAELARLIDHDPFDDFDGLQPEQQSRSGAPQQSAPQQAAPRPAPAQRYAPPAAPPPAQRLVPPQPTRAALQPPPRPAAVEPDYDEDDDAEAWNTAPARQPAVPARAAPSYAPEPQSRAPQGYGQSGYAQPAPSYAPAPRPADPRAADVRLGYGSLARDAAAARAVPPPQQQPAQDYDDYDDDYDDGVDDPRQPDPRNADPRNADPRARAASYGQGQAPQAQQAYGRADAQGYRQDARSQDARYQDARYPDDRRPASGQPSQQAARYDDETDEAGYAYSAARRDEDYDYDDYDDRYDPEYADDGYMPPHGDEMYEPEPRRRRGRTALLLGVSLVGLLVAGVAGVFAYNMAVGRSGLMSSSSAPPVIKADSAPAKTTTPATADAQKSIYDRVGGPVTAGNEKMVPREEQPVDVTSAARAPADSAPAATQQPMQATQNLTEPKRVRTMTVRADGSVTPGVPSSAVSAYAPSQNPIPVGLPQPNPVTTVPASAPADATASTSPAPTAAGTYVVQVASQRSESDALGSWKALQAKYPNLLGSYKATVKKADLGDKGIYYRAQVGPFAGRDQANELCQSLRAQGGDCVVTKN
ncbi:SPOR domain-containing protein [Xanthobacter sp. 126]|uniref:SPOR domain-containing protein n=1 Tax=Xanthobacter sp. 126 TaxID=1131814 RepID=UPI0004AEB333|nr:SPOR domain-containing protein [Xanthobacter sp. 126]